MTCWIKKKDITVVICCAGMGTRLGIGTTKALVNLLGEPLIIKQLKLLNEFDDIRIVVGYDADKVIEVVKEYRKDVIFVMNYDFEDNGPADSLKKALLGSRKYVITLDGDTIINPFDFKEFIDYPFECIAINKNSSCETIAAVIDDVKVVSLSKEPSEYQWSGVTKLHRDKYKGDSPYLYENLKQFLPIDAFFLRLKEINTQRDYENAINWMNEGMR